MAWNDMKKAREEEYFLKQERNNTDELKRTISEIQKSSTQAREQMTSFHRGYSPLTGASMFRSTVAGSNIIDCPEEGVLMITYEDLLYLIEHSPAEDDSPLNIWRSFLTDHEINTTEEVLNES